MSTLAPTIEAFFTERLLNQRQASPRTVAAYRDTLRLLLGFVRDRTGKEPAQLDLADLDAELVSAFLAHLELQRHNSVRTRNARLAAIRSLFRFAALRHPEHAGLIQRVLAIPPKRYERGIVSFLTPAEIDTVLDTLTGRPGMADGTTPCSFWRSKQDCGSPSSPGSPARTCNSAPLPTCGATARDARTASRH